MTDLRKLAEGKDCLLRIPGVCCRDSTTVVLCHIKYSGWCGSLKPPDIVGVWGCWACHDVIDGRQQSDFKPEELEAMILRALCEQLVIYSKTNVVRW